MVNRKNLIYLAAWILIQSAFCNVEVSQDTTQNTETHTCNIVLIDGKQYMIIGLKHVSMSSIDEVTSKLIKNKSLNITNFLIALSNLALFKNISLQGDKIILEEWPSVFDVCLKINNANFYEDSIAGIKQKQEMLRYLNIKMQYPISPRQIFELIESLKVVARRQYKAANIISNAEIILDSKQRSVLHITIDTITHDIRNEIRFTGNKYFSSRELRLSLPTKTHTFAYIFSYPICSDEISEYKDSIQKYGVSHGFLDMKVNSIKIVPNKSEHVVDYIIDIYEGVRYKINDINIFNESSLSEGELVGMLNFTTGAPASHSLFNQYLKNVRLILFERHNPHNNFRSFDVKYNIKKNNDGTADVCFYIMKAKKLSYPNVKINSQYLDHSHVLEKLNILPDVPILMDDIFLALCKRRLSISESCKDVSCDLSGDTLNIETVDRNCFLSPNITFDGSLTGSISVLAANQGRKRDLCLNFDSKFSSKTSRAKLMISKNHNSHPNATSNIFVQYANTRRCIDNLYSNNHLISDSLDEALNGRELDKLFARIRKHHIVIDPNCDTLESSYAEYESEKKFIKELAKQSNITQTSVRCGIGNTIFLRPLTKLSTSMALVVGNTELTDTFKDSKDKKNKIIQIMPHYIRDSIGSYSLLESKVSFMQRFNLNKIKFTLNPIAHLALGTPERSFLKLDLQSSITLPVNSYISLTLDNILKKSFNQCFLDNIRADTMNGILLGPVDIANGSYLGFKNFIHTILTLNIHAYRNHVFSAAFYTNVQIGKGWNADVKQSCVPEEICDGRNWPYNTLSVANENKSCVTAGVGCKLTVLAFMIDFSLRNHVTKNSLHRVSPFVFSIGMAER